MRKITALFLAVLMLLVFASCGNDKNNESKHESHDVGTTSVTSKETVISSDSGTDISSENESETTESKTVTGSAYESSKSDAGETYSSKSESSKADTEKGADSKPTETGKSEDTSSSSVTSGGGEDHEGELIGGKSIELPTIPLH